MADITITEGDTLEVDYSLENTGDGTGTFDPRLLVEGVQEDQDTGITLNPAQTATGTLQWPTENGDAVTDALAEAVTDDTSDSILVTVEEAGPPSGISRWTFDNADTSAGTAIDVFGDNDATINGATTGAAGANQTYTTNEAYEFDGANDWLDTGITSLDTPLTIAFWAYPESLDNDVAFGNFNATGDDLFVGFSGGGYKFQYDAGGFNISGAGSPPANQWSFYTYVIDTTTAYIYRDATEEETATNNTTGTVDNGSTFVIGRNQNNSAYFDGRLDDLRLYSKALSPAEVSSLYNTGSIS